MYSILLLCMLLFFAVLIAVLVILFIRYKKTKIKIENFKRESHDSTIILITKDNCIDCCHIEQDFDSVSNENKEDIAKHNITLKKYNMSKTEIPSNISKYIIDIPCVMLFNGDKFIHENHGKNSIENFVEFLDATDTFQIKDESIS